MPGYWSVSCLPLTGCVPVGIPGRLKTPMATHRQQLPFRAGDCVAVAYVPGSYGARSARPGRRCFLGLYLARGEHRFSFWTFTTDGRRVAFSRIEGANLEFALIQAAISYAIPFDQWRPYPADKSDRRIIRQLGLVEEYGEVHLALCRVLYQARVLTYFRVDEMAAKLGYGPESVRPHFCVRQRSRSAILRDITERDEIYRAVLGHT